MATICTTQARGQRMRLTRLDECGAPVEGTASTLVTSGFVSVGVSPQYQDPEEITVPNANGDPCIDDQGTPQFRWLELDIQMCLVDPDAVNIITGNPLVVDDATPTANTVGFRIDKSLTGTAAFALELWTGVTGQACGVGGTAQRGYWLFPFVVQAQFNDWTFENGALTLDMTARTSDGSGWGVGPYNVRADATTQAPEPLLTAIASDQHMHYEVVTIAPPAAACGATELVIP
jgi:hypothetical protein